MVKRTKNRKAINQQICFKCGNAIVEKFYDNKDNNITYLRICPKCGVKYKKKFPLNGK